MDNTLNKKQIKKIITEKVKSGMPKQQVFEEMIPENKIGKDLAQIIQSIPSVEAKNKYKSAHILFVVLLILLLLILIMVKSYAGIIWTCPILYLVFTVQPRYYSWALAPALYGVTPGLQLILYPIQGMEALSLTIGVPIVLISLLILGIGFYLSRKLTPNFTRTKESYEDDDGNIRYRLVLRFKD